MSTVLARRIASTPARTAAQTWEKIVEIVAPDPKSPARKELAKAAGVACASIASEATKDAPIVVWDGGPRVRIYCVFDEDAITQDSVNEDALPKSPTVGDWKMSIPCQTEDVAWSNKNLVATSSRISARGADEEIEEAASEAAAASAAKSPLSLNLTEFLKS
jgi:hypothetical protein